MCLIPRLAGMLTRVDYAEVHHLVSQQGWMKKMRLTQQKHLMQGQAQYFHIVHAVDMLTYRHLSLRLVDYDASMQCVSRILTRNADCNKLICDRSVYCHGLFSN